MLTRIFTLFVIAMLALPFAETTRTARAGTSFPYTVTPPLPASVQLVDNATPPLRAKKKNKKNKKSKFKTVNRIVRQPLTQTFSNTTPIAIPDDAPADHYPSSIDVTGFANGAITDVNLTLHGYSHGLPRDVNVLLAPAHLPGLDASVMSDVCGFDPGVADITLTLDDQAAAPLPIEDPCVSGTFQPTNFVADDVFPAPAPVPSQNSLLSVFNAANPNGTWRLFVFDDNDDDVGLLAGGWTLQISAETDVQVQEQVKIKPKKKNKKKR